MSLSFRFIFFVSPVVLLAFAVDVTAQSKPEKLRIGYAARAVAHSVPFVAKEAGFFAEEGIDAEVVRTAGSIGRWRWSPTRSIWQSCPPT